MKRQGGKSRLGGEDRISLPELLLDCFAGRFRRPSLHPLRIDLRKYSRAWQVLKKSLGHKLAEIRAPVTAPASEQQLNGCLRANRVRSAHRVGG